MNKIDRMFGIKVNFAFQHWFSTEFSILIGLVDEVQYLKTRIIFNCYNISQVIWTQETGE